MAAFTVLGGALMIVSVGLPSRDVFGRDRGSGWARVRVCLMLLGFALVIVGFIFGSGPSVGTSP